MSDSGAAQLSEESKAFLRKPYVAEIATIGATTGHPQLSVVWIDVDGNDILFNTNDERHKAKNLLQSPAVAVVVVDPADSHNMLSVRGTVTEITTEGADEHIDFLTHKYTGSDKFPGHEPGRKRVKVRIRPDRILAEPRAEP
jgi:PPOX class probable F420-dependent enzyme